MTNSEKLDYLDNKIIDILLHDDVRRTISKCEVELTIYVSPWFGTSVRHFCAILAHLLKNRGNNVSILIDDVISYVEYNCEDERAHIISFFKRVETLGFPMGLLSEHFEDHDLTVDDLSIIEKCSDARTIHQLGYTGDFKHEAEIREIHSTDLKRSVPYIKEYIKDYVGAIVVPGGICGNAGLIHEYSKQNPKVRFISYDTYITSSVIISNDIATHFFSVKESYKMSGEKLACWEDAILWSENELKRRMDGDSEVTSIKKNSRVTQYDVVIVMNVENDSAALLLDGIFDNMAKWIESTVDYIYNHTDASVAIRQHPGEVGKHRGFFWSEWLNEKYPNNTRVTFIPCFERINTYQLISQAKLVLPWSSTVGIEAAMLGKQVIMNCNAYYSDTSFVIKCHSFKEYVERIVRCLEKNDKQEDNRIKEEAKVFYFLSQKCSFVNMPYLSPETDIIMKFSDYDLQNSQYNKEVQIMMRVIEEDVPIQIIRARDKG